MNKQFNESLTTIPVGKREERQPTPSEKERIEHAQIAREIAKQNTAEMLKVNNFNNPQL